MPRLRKDGKPAQRAVRVGRSRISEQGKKWAVRAYRPTPENPYGRVTFIRPGGQSPTSAVPKEGQSLDELFEKIEAAYNRQVALGGERPVEGQGRRDMRALGELYLGWLEANNRSDGYISNRGCIIRKWVVANIGDVLVSEWSSEDSLRVLNAARGSVGSARLSDIGSTLSGMRATAHRKRSGGRWLDPTEDPLEGCSYSNRSGTQSQSSKFVPVHMRPSDASVENAIAAAEGLSTFDWMPRIIKVAAYEASRLGEQLALRAIDVEFKNRMLDINGSWTVERKAEKDGEPRRRWRASTKNGLRRQTPFAESRRQDLLIDCRAALKLPPDTAEEVVIAVIEQERTRRAHLTKTGIWQDYAESAAEEPWLFVDASGLPPTKERFNDAWHQVRDASGWDRKIPYKNMRHYAIQRWKRKLELNYEDLAVWSGHDHRTLEAYYRVPGQDALSQAQAKLDDL